MRTEQKITQLVAQRAAELKENLASGDPRDRAALDAWLRDSKLHVEAYLDISALDRQIEALDPSCRPDIEAIVATAGNIRELQPGALASSGAAKRPRRGVWSVAAAIAGITLLAFAGVLGYPGLFTPKQLYTTAVGERRTVTLSDGSTIEMNVDTSLQVKFDEEQRDIDLLSGEAVFKAARDAARPFTVHTRTAHVRALGTEFNVYQRHSTVVSVLEGRVQVTPMPFQGTTVASLAAGEEAQIRQGRIEKRAHADVAKTAAWRQGRLYFDNMPLEEIVQEFNRQGGPLRLTLEGIAPGTYRFGGSFNVNDASALADILEQQPDLIVERKPTEILIQPRRPERERQTK
jgi:transmembrane sensor